MSRRCQAILSPYARSGSDMADVCPTLSFALQRQTRCACTRPCPIWICMQCAALIDGAASGWVWCRPTWRHTCQPRREGRLLGHFPRTETRDLERWLRLGSSATPMAQPPAPKSDTGKCAGTRGLDAFGGAHMLLPLPGTYLAGVAGRRPRDWSAASDWRQG